MQSQIARSSLLLRLPGIEHGFVSDHTPGGRDALDLLLPKIATVKQVHGDLTLWTERVEKREREADGLATFTPGLSVGVYSADCTPILSVAFDAHGPIAVMAVHAGWRGTAKRIAEKSFLAFMEAARGRGASRFVAAIGPCIGFDSFEVGQEVVDAFPGSLERGQARFLRTEGSQKKFQFDLAGENARQMNAAATQSGVKLELDEMKECTFQRKDIYPSYRRDREKAGRILSYLCFKS